MKKTAIQLLIDKWKESKPKGSHGLIWQMFIDEATELLETEREQIEEGVKFGLRQRHDVFQGQEHTDAEQYYKETYG